MMLLILSSLMIIAYTIYFCFHAAEKKETVSSTCGKCISMALGMVSSTIIGLIFDIFLPGELAYSTVLAIVVSFVVAFFIGRHFGLSAIIEAFGASFMGAMMGAMLGDMIPENRQSFMFITMDIIYVVTVILFMFILNNDAVKEKRMRRKIATPLILSLILSLSLIGLVATIEGGTQDVNKKQENLVEHHH